MAEESKNGGGYSSQILREEIEALHGLLRYHAWMIRCGLEGKDQTVPNGVIHPSEYRGDPKWREIPNFPGNHGDLEQPYKTWHTKQIRELSAEIQRLRARMGSN